MAIKSVTETTFSNVSYLWYCETCTDLNVEFVGTDDTIVLKMPSSKTIENFVKSFLEFSCDNDFRSQIIEHCAEVIDKRRQREEAAAANG